MTRATTSPRPNRRVLAKAATTQKVLQAGKSLFETVGYEKATIRAIAKAAGMSTGAVFANYKDKAALYVAAYGHPPLKPEVARALLAKATVSALAVHKAFGGPSEYVDDSSKGGALIQLYRTLNDIVAVMPVQQAQPEGVTQ